MDSGSIVTICPEGCLDDDQIKETPASKSGVGYNSADGGSIKNMGEGIIKAKSEDGIDVEFTAQVGDKIKRMLIAVCRAVDAGNMVVFGANRDSLKALAGMKDLDKNLIISNKTHVTSKIHERDGLYTYPVWIKRPKTKDGNGKSNVATIQKDDEGFWTPF